MIRGERGPTGDHGQTGDTGAVGNTGDTGDTGLRGREGTPGAEGPQGHIGLTGATPPKERTVLLSTLKTVTVLMGLIIIGTAMWLAVTIQNDNQRLVEDRDTVRDQLTIIQAEQALERASDECYDEYTAAMSSAAQHTRALLARMDAAIARGLLTFIPVPLRPTGAVLDPAALLNLIDETDAAALADEAANQARADWVAGGRPLPCTID